MADFETTANAVVSLLQELETIASSAGDDFIAAAPRFEKLAAKGKQHADEVEEGINALEKRVTETRQKTFDRIGEVKQRLAKIYFEVNTFAELVKQEMTQRENKVEALDGRLEIQNSTVHTLSNELVAEVEVVTGTLNASNDVMKADFDKMEEQIEAGQQILGEMTTNFEREVKELTNFVEDRCIEATQQNTDHAEAQIGEYWQTWYNNMDNAIDLLSDDLSTAVERIQAAEKESRGEVDALVQDVDETYDSEKVDAAAEKTQQSTQEMNQQMKQGESSFNDSVTSFTELLEVVKKMVQ